jgi:hypothetical protein
VVEVTTDPVVALKNVLGVHEYVMLPVGEEVAVKVADDPEQMVGLLTVIVGVVFTVTVEDFEDVHPLRVPVTK